jgi:hypothetical protein
MRIVLVLVLALWVAKESGTRTIMAEDVGDRLIVLVVVLVVDLLVAKESRTTRTGLVRGESGSRVPYIEAIDQATQHCYDTREHLLAGANTVGGNQSFSDRRIEASGTL